MTDKIPEALAVLDQAERHLSSSYRGSKIDCAYRVRKARAAFAAEHIALTWAVNNPDDSAYWIAQAKTALAAVEELK